MPFVGPNGGARIRHWSRTNTGEASQGGTPTVTVNLDEADPPNVQIILGNLAARRLLLALGMNGKRHGQEVKAITDGLSTLLIGQVAGEEPANPHGPDHDCPHCRILQPLHPESMCCNPCFWETPELFIQFPTQCPHRVWSDS